MADIVYVPDYSEPWQPVMAKAVKLYLDQEAVAHGVISPEHIIGTPDRVVKAFQEYFRGCAINPADCLNTDFSSGKYDEMVHKEVAFVSNCCHHLAAIIAKAHFAYIPNGRIVGLSKINRFINVLAKRPQIQEQLCSDIADVFQESKIAPAGCGVIIRGYHMCTIARGVEERPSLMETTALRGVFKTDPEVRQEFLASIDRSSPVFP